MFNADVDAATPCVYAPLDTHLFEATASATMNVMLMTPVPACTVWTAGLHKHHILYTACCPDCACTYWCHEAWEAASAPEATAAVATLCS